MRDTVRVVGPDAAGYLQSQVTQDLRSLPVGGSTWAFLLQPSGRIDVLVHVRRAADDDFHLDTDAGFGGVLTARLNRFRIRVKADVETIEWDGSDDVPTDRVAAVWPAMGSEIVPGETLVAETGLAPVAVSFTKGCYPGQELVERMASRDAAPPRLLRRLAIDEARRLHAEGSAEITTTAGDWALAYVKRSAQAAG